MDTPVEFDWPLRYTALPDGTVTLAQVTQGTQQAREAAAGVVMSTRRGQRLDDPAFGVTDLRFQQGYTDTRKLADELGQSDPSLTDLDVSETLDIADARARTLAIDVGA